MTTVRPRARARRARLDRPRGQSRSASPAPRQVTNAVCRFEVDPRVWSRHVNDQAIVIGWAGYDAKVRYLPPEHFLALEFRDALWEACCGGALARRRG